VTPWVTPDRDVERRFWRFVHARQTAWQRRRDGMPQAEWWPPAADAAEADWPGLHTACPYRECSPRAVAINSRLSDHVNMVDPWLRPLARLMVWRTYGGFVYKVLTDPIGVRLLDGDPREGMANDLSEHWAALVELALREEECIGGAELPRAKEPGDDNTEALAAEIVAMVRASREATKAFCKAPTIRGQYEVLAAMPGARPAAAWEVACDLAEPLADGRTWSRGSLDQWAPVSSQAAKALNAMGVKGPQATLLHAVRDMAARQSLAFEALCLDFPWLHDRSGAEVQLSLVNVERCLGEFAKTLNTKGRKRYSPSGRGELVRPIGWYDSPSWEGHNA